MPGRDGADGRDGVDGQNCWDLNGNGRADMASEDANGDRAVDVRDCRGTQGPQGPAGPSGVGLSAGPYGGIPIRNRTTDELVGGLLFTNSTTQLGTMGPLNEAVMIDPDSGTRYFLRFRPRFLDSTGFSAERYSVDLQFSILDHPHLSAPYTPSPTASIHFEYAGENCNGARALQVASADWLALRLGLTGVYGLWADRTVATPARAFTSRSTGSYNQREEFSCVNHPKRTQQAMLMVPVDMPDLSDLYLDMSP